MKNSIPNHEYLLLTDAVLDNYEPLDLDKSFDWASLARGSDRYGSIGELHYHFVFLDSLHQQIPAPPPPPEWTHTNAELCRSIEISCPPQHVYEIVTDLSRRAEFQPGVKRIEHRENEVNRIGSEHVCILPLGKPTFETIRAPRAASGRMYAERTPNVPFVKEFTQLINMEEIPTGTKVEIQAFFQPKGWLGKQMVPVFKKRFIKGLDSFLENLKELCEREAIQLKQQGV